MKRWIFAVTAPIVLIGQPLQAEDEKAEQGAEALAVLTEAFHVEPLAPEARARLPLATEIIEQILPDGAMNELVGSMFDRILGPVAKIAELSGPKLADYVGYSESDLGLTDEQVAEVAAIVDPAWQVRQRRTLEFTQGAMIDAMAAMEPAMKRGMAEAYAEEFTQAELAGIKAFFSTEVGTSYARKSSRLSSNPRILSAAMSEVPRMIDGFAAMAEGLKEAQADLPAAKTFDTLHVSERARVRELTGLADEELRLGMETAAEQAARKSPF